MNNERTIYDGINTPAQDNEATQFGGASNTNNTAYGTVGTKTTPTLKKEKKAAPVWQKVAAGLGGGIVLGTGSAVLMSSMLGGEEPDPNQEPEQTTEPTSELDSLIVGDVAKATSVTEDMSFSEAFAAARAEVGPGGVFEWHGQLYGTYTAAEWDNMTAEEQHGFNENFAWTSSSNEHDTTLADNHDTNDNHEVPEVKTDDQVVADEDVQVKTSTPDDNIDNYDGPESEVVAVVDESDVEILGVVHDDETGANIGGMVIGDQEVVLVDIDGDGTFDLMAADINGDMELSDDEFIDISEQGLTVDDLGGISETDDGLFASNDDGMDYTESDGIYEG